MGCQRRFAPEKLIAGLLLSSEAGEPEILSLLEEQWGPVDYRSGTFPFSFTDYYNREMGEDLRRLYLSFENPVDPESLAEIKLRTNRLEESLAREGLRRVNIDPGLLTLGHVILASTKSADHRIPLREGIYGELTLVFRRGAWADLPWTYPDYRAPEAKDAMTAIRDIYKGQRRFFFNAP